MMVIDEQRKQTNRRICCCRLSSNTFHGTTVARTLGECWSNKHCLSRNLLPSTYKQQVTERDRLCPSKCENPVCHQKHVEEFWNSIWERIFQKNFLKMHTHTHTHLHIQKAERHKSKVWRIKWGFCTFAFY